MRPITDHSTVHNPFTWEPWGQREDAGGEAVKLKVVSEHRVQSGF